VVLGTDLTCSVETCTTTFSPWNSSRIRTLAGNDHLLVLLKFCVCFFKVFQPGNNPMIAVLAEKYVLITSASLS
jgi:hypothetical protein